jgi:molybdopterin synthase sulfur carrier subunit
VLCLGNPDLCQAIYDGEQLRPFVRITVNGHDIMLGQGLDTPLEESDSIAIFPPIAGG